MLFEGGFTFSNFLLDAFVIFMFIVWLLLLITVFSDLFRRDDTSGAVKVLWIIFLVVLPYLGVFLYLMTQGSSMAHRHEAQASKMRDELRSVVGFSAADEIEKLERLKAAGTISPAEYSKLRAKLV